MQNRRNFYRLLQVQPDAPIEVIKSNYWTLLQKLRLHPDLGGDTWSASQINQAYATLRDPQQRAAYDKQLLRDYHIQVLSQGRLSAKLPAPRRAPAAAGTGNRNRNRRNYYRILHIQTDAPAAIITASYRLQMKNPRQPIKLIREAYAVLSDPRKRKAYDRSLKQRTHSCSVDPRTPRSSSPPAAVTPINRRGPPVSHYRPLITQFCPFCKTPHAHSSMGDHNELCVECASPLFAAPREVRHHGQRGLSRISRRDPLQYYLDWPGRSYSGMLMDLSLDGLCFNTARHLQPRQIIKVESGHFKCVAEVMHCQPGAAGESVGSRFITLLFDRQQGNFISAQA